MKDEGVHKQLDSLFEALHNQYSISKLFVEGFCWGGNYALELAATDKVRLCSTLMTLSRLSSWVSSTQRHVARLSDVVSPHICR